jgi:hypothetical protein
LTVNGKIFRNIFIILAPIYATALLVLGAYMIFMSHSPRGRAQAKMMIDKLIVSMIVVPVSPAIYEILLQTSNILSRSVISIVLSETGRSSIGSALMKGVSISVAPLSVIFLYSPHAGGIMILSIGLILLFALFMTLATMWFRYLTVKTFAFLFPLILFMYLFDWTRHIGAMLLKYTLVWIFTPIISAVFLATGIMIAVSSQTRWSSWTSGSGMGALSNIMGIILNPTFLIVTLMLTWIAPLVMSGVMKVLGGIVSAVSMVVPGPYGMVLAAAGGVMQGKSVSELATVGVMAAAKKSVKSLKGAASGKKGATGAGGGQGPVSRIGRIAQAAKNVSKAALKNPAASAAWSGAKKGARAIKNEAGSGYKGLANTPSAARQGASTVRDGYRASRAQGKGRIRSSYEGLKTGAKQFHSTATGKGSENVGADKKAAKGGQPSKALTRMQESGVINQDQSASLQKNGLTTNSAIANADQTKLESALGSKEKANEVRAAAKDGVEEDIKKSHGERDLKQSLSSPGYSQKERNLDLEEWGASDDE